MLKFRILTPDTWHTLSGRKHQSSDISLLPYTFPLFAGVPKSTGIAAGFVKNIHFLQFGLVDPVDDHLGNPVSSAEGVRFGAKIDNGDLDLTTVVGIDGARGVDKPDAVFDRQTAAGSDLGFIARRQRHGKAGGQQGYFAFWQPQRFGDGNTDIHAGRLRGHVPGQGNV